jgi:methionyl-tRNA formyltransferase
MKLIFAGTPAIAAQALAGISEHHEVLKVITRQDAPVGRKQVLTESAVAIQAKELGLPVLKRNRLAEADRELLADLGADLAVVVAYGALIPQALLEIMPWWNLHFSLLPKWRGATPLQHSMLNSSEGSGITVFRLDAGMDTGPLISQLPIPIDYQKTCGEHLEEFTKRGTDLVLEALSAPATETPQRGESSLAPKISRADARLDVQQPAELLAMKVMALNPEPTAWCELDGQPLRILRARSLGNTDWDALDQSLGNVGLVEFANGKVQLHCGNGTRLELIEIQPAGKKPMLAGDWFRGITKEIVLD